MCGGVLLVGTLHQDLGMSFHQKIVLDLDYYQYELDEGWL